YRRTPFGTSIAVAVLAVGIALASAFLSLYVDLTMRVHPGLGSAERLMTIGWTDGDVSGGVPLELIERIAAETTTLDFAAGALSYALPGETETTFVSVE